MNKRFCLERHHRLLEKQEHRIQCQLKNNEGLSQTGMEQKMQTKKNNTADVGPRISSTMDCMTQMIQRD